jgi:hypothetical protein
MEIIRPSNLSVVFLSFEEPDKENNWSHLKERVDHAVRVDGVKGFDAAHKAAAAAAETERFVLVDGDALVYDTFWDLNIRIPTKYQDGVLPFQRSHQIGSAPNHNELAELLVGKLCQQISSLTHLFGRWHFVEREQTFHFRVIGRLNYVCGFLVRACAVLGEVQDVHCVDCLCRVLHDYRPISV